MNPKKISILVISGLLILFFTTATWARDPFQNRQYRQRERIRQGIENGEITKHELRNLKQGQKRIRQYTQRASKDGKISRHERRTIARMQDRAGKQIYKAKHNRHYRYNNNRRYNRHHKYQNADSYKCYRSYRRHHKGYYPHGDSYYFSGTWFEPGGFFSFSTGGNW